MSLIQEIKTRRLEDVINEGAKVALTGTMSGSGTDQVLFASDTSRSIIVSGFTLSSSSGSVVLMSLGFKPNGGSTLNFFQGYVNSITRTYALGDWYRGGPGDSLVITSAAACAYTVDVRLGSTPLVLGYIEHEFGRGASGHRAKAVFPDEAGANRGLMEI